MKYDISNKRVWVAGHRGMVGSAVVEQLRREPCELLLVGRESLDLVNQQAVASWVKRERPDVVVIAAAKVGGILANDTTPADFIVQNLMIETNIIHSAFEYEVEKLLFLGSSCAYPKHAPQPIKEEYLLSGPLEPTNESYALAKIAGIKLCEAYRRQYGCDFISIQPSNLYGPGDNYDLQTAHVLPALLRKFHEAKQLGSPKVVVWGTGHPLREFMYVHDLADAIVFLLKNYSDGIPINVGTGKEISVGELVRTIANVVGYSPEIEFDATKPDGTMRKLLDCTRLRALGWDNARPLVEGLEATYKSFLESQALK